LRRRARDLGGAAPVCVARPSADPVCRRELEPELRPGVAAFRVRRAESTGRATPGAPRPAHPTRRVYRTSPGRAEKGGREAPPRLALALALALAQEGGPTARVRYRGPVRRSTSTPVGHSASTSSSSSASARR